MRQTKLTKAMALMLSLVMITSVFVGNTLSKYVTSVNSTDSARVAIWGINGHKVEMELFNMNYDLDGKLIAKSNNGEKIIAPGTGGTSLFSIVNLDQNIPPEVAYQVKIDLDDSQVDEKIKNNTSIQWKLDNGSWGTWNELKNSLLLLSGNESGVHTYEPGTFADAFKSGIEHTIAWQWAIDGNNNIDTQMGNLAFESNISAKVTVKVIAIQVDDLTTNAYLISGANQIVNLNYVQPLTFKSSADFGTFESIKINGETVDSSNYTAQSGSTIITLTEEYLSTLAVGTYTIEIISSENTAITNFYVVNDLEDNMAMLAEGNTWYKSTKARSTITTINIVNEASEDIINNADESWPAAVDFAGDGELDDDVMCYLDGTTLTIAGNGSNKIYANYNSSFAFSDSSTTKDYFSNVETISNAELLDTSKVQNMRGMFFNDSSLKTINVSNWDTSNVTNMSILFASNNINKGMSLESLDVSNWNTSKVTNMSGMFQLCNTITSLDVSNWNTSKVKDMSAMFQIAESLVNLDVSNWDTGNVVDMSFLFSTSLNTMAITSLDVSNWDTSKVINMRSLFQNCANLTSLNVSNWDTGNVVNMGNLFRGCTNLIDLDISNWDVRKVEDMSCMFDSVSKLATPDFSKWETNSLTDMSFMFYAAFKKATLDVSAFDTSKVTNFDHWIAQRYSPLSGYENLDTSSATNMGAFFHSCSNETIDVSNLDVSKNINFSQFFEQCNKVVEIIGLDNFNTSNGIAFDEMFNQCLKLKKLNLINFDTRKAHYGTKISDNGGKSLVLWHMFNGCYRLEEVTVGENFSLNGNGTNTRETYGAANVFNAPDSTYITGADGYWYDTDGTQYSPTAMPDKTANIYYAVNPISNS